MVPLSKARSTCNDNKQHPLFNVHVTIPIQPILYQPKPSIITQNRIHVQQNVHVTLNATMLGNNTKIQLVGEVH
jgi:hypothetical protein